MSYPKWLYGPSGAVLVMDEEAHQALSGEWVESPELVGKVEDAVEPEKRKPGRPKKAE